MSSLLSILSSIYDEKFNTNEAELLQCNNPSTKSYTELLPVKKKEWKEEPIKEIPCNTEPIDKFVSDVNFIMDEQTVLKLIEYRKLEIIKKLQIFKLNIALFSNLCMHIKLAIKRNYPGGKKLYLILNKETVKSYIENFMLDTNQNYLLKCKKDIIFLENQLCEKLKCEKILKK
jgi:hypothetical protein